MPYPNFADKHDHPVLTEPASFVRYWGEGHVLESPANIRDMWTRVFAWLDEFSPRATTQAGAQRTP